MSCGPLQIRHNSFEKSWEKQSSPAYLQNLRQILQILRLMTIWNANLLNPKAFDSAIYLFIRPNNNRHTHDSPHPSCDDGFT